MEDDIIEYHAFIASNVILEIYESAEYVKYVYNFDDGTFAVKCFSRIIKSRKEESWKREKLGSH